MSLTAEAPDNPQTAPGNPKDPRAEAAAAAAYHKAQRPWYQKKRFIALGLLIAFVAIASSSSSDSEPTTATSDPAPGASSATPASSDSKSGDSSCGTKATDDCTPNVSSDQAVRVDALTWQYVSSRATTTLGDQQYGLGATADDTFLVVKLQVTSNKNESASISDEAVKLESKEGNLYSADSDGTVAAMGSGEDPLFYEDLGPDQTTTSKIVFDVPQSVLDAGAKLRFNELGFGETHAYIKLP